MYVCMYRKGFLGVAGRGLDWLCTLLSRRKLVVGGS